MAKSLSRLLTMKKVDKHEKIKPRRGNLAVIHTDSVRQVFDHFSTEFTLHSQDSSSTISTSSRSLNINLVSLNASVERRAPDISSIRTPDITTRTGSSVNFAEKIATIQVVENLKYSLSKEEKKRLWAPPLEKEKGGRPPLERQKGGRTELELSMNECLLANPTPKGNTNNKRRRRKSQNRRSLQSSACEQAHTLSKQQEEEQSTKSPLRSPFRSPLRGLSSRLTRRNNGDYKQSGITLPFRN